MGIEVGQLAFVSVVIAAAFALRRVLARVPAWAGQVPAYAIGSLAALWCIERSVALFGW